MADFLVLDDFAAANLPAGAILSDTEHDVDELATGGAALLAYNPATMAEAVLRFESLPFPRRTGALVGLLAAAGAIGGGGPGTGDVVGPAGATDNTVARYNGPTGKLIQGSAVGITDTGSITLPVGQTVDGRDVSADGAKLDTIETGADVTDAVNVAAAGAVMEADYTPAHSLLAQQAGTGSPSIVTMGTDTLLGRLAGGGSPIAGLTAAQVKTILAFLAPSDFAGTWTGDVVRTGATSFAALRHNLAAVVAPTTGDDSTANYAVGSRWIDILAGRAWFCIDATAGAAVWLELGGGGGIPQASMLEGFSAGNRYEGAAGQLPGDDGGFIAAALVEVQSVPTLGGQSIFTNYQPGVDGWQIGIESGLRVVVGVQVASGIQQALYPTVLEAPFAGLGLLLIVLRVRPVGADRHVEMWLQGRLVVAATVETGSIVPGTGAPLVGAGPFGNVAEQSGILGVQYRVGTLTDAQLRAHADATMASRDVVDAGLGFTSWSVRRGAPGATWAPSDGVGPTFSRVGSLSIATRDGSRFLS